MSYAGKDPRSRRTTGAADRSTSAFQRGRARPEERTLEREISITRGGTGRAGPISSHQDAELDWQHIGIFVAGALLGAALGAGTALLLAPQSGAETRHRLARHSRHLTERSADAWTDLRDELRYAARRSKRKLAHRLQRAKRERRLRRELQDDGSLTDD